MTPTNDLSMCGSLFQRVHVCTAVYMYAFPFGFVKLCDSKVEENSITLVSACLVRFLRYI